MPIKVLSSNAINRIAAGEVIERPLSVVKELVENALDAKATKVSIELSRGGRNFVSIADDGCGIAKNDLALALERHATSKLDEEKIDDINFLGFRGEALPSIASVSKLKIISAYAGEAWEINSSGGVIEQVKPSARQKGTCVEMRDLFYTTPARLKFLKSESAETTACNELVNKLALSRPDVAFKLVVNDQEIINCQASTEIKDRIGAIIGKEFMNNSLEFSASSAGLKIYGLASIPTYNAATSVHQHFFVNNRMVKDKVFTIAVKAAYSSLIPHNRAARIVLFMEIDNKLVDVNVHPTKAEVRFIDPQKVKGLIIDGIRSALTKSEARHSTAISAKAVSFLKPLSGPNSLQDKVKAKNYAVPKQNFHRLLHEHQDYLQNKGDIGADEKQQPALEIEKPQQEKQYTPDFSAPPSIEKRVEMTGDFPLGFAKCQIDKTYIIAEKSGCLILIDQHAAHERITLEKIKKQLAGGKVAGQMLLVPEIVELGNVLTDSIVEKQKQLQQFGLIIERNGISQVLVRQVPAILPNLDISGFTKTIAENVHILDDVGHLQNTIDVIWGNIACHTSIRAGREMKIEEMNALLREIERNPLAGQCNHGRPTFVKLDFKDIEKIFERI
jgi:DNA mismatch repair protein MutL